MKRVLIVSPSFPPVSTADQHRVRTSLPHFTSFGWVPHVLAIDPSHHGGLIEPELVATVPADIPITRVGALPERITRLAGIRNAGLRALGRLYREGDRLLAREPFDLVYFSTTMFPVMTLGRLWKMRHGTPYVLDLQDPWKTEYRGAGQMRGLKAGAARMMHSALEPLAMRSVNGVIAVSPSYIDILRRRYPWIAEEDCAVIPFGASANDFDAAAARPWRNPFFAGDDGRIHGVAVGRGGRDLRPAAELLFSALHLLGERGRVLDCLRLWFIGTDYSARGARTISPAAKSAGVERLVHESPARVPYLEALRLLRDSSLTIILGSDDPSYSPSKVYPYLLAGKPFVAVLHSGSPVADLLDAAGTGIVARFTPGADTTLASARLADALGHLLDALPARAPVAERVLAPLAARELTRRQCAVFNHAIGREAAEGVPCTG